MRVDCARLGWSTARRPRLSAAQRGQSMVEFAFCIPVFLLLLFGTFEVGMLYKTHAAYDQAAQQAVRIAASAGNAGNADAQMLTALQHTLASQDLTQIAAATVYDATVDGTQVPGSPQTIYVYSPSLGHFVCQGAPTALPCPPPTPPATYTYWDPLARDTKVGELDHIGLRLTVRYRGPTGLLPPTTLSEGATTLIEPNSYQP